VIRLNPNPLQPAFNVTHSANLGLQRKCACATSGSAPCSTCAVQPEDEHLHRKATSETESPEVPEIVYDVLRSGGLPLDHATREFMEPRFGHDFSDVRVHGDDRASQSAEGLNARAYAVGRDIVFAPGQYAPGTSEGRQLLAHELTHVVQQNGRQTDARNLQVGDSNSSAELEAERIAGRIHNASLDQSVATVSPLSVQRAAPAAAAGIGALAAKCIIGAIVGVLFDLAIQSGMHMWRRGSMTLQGLSVDYCSVILSAILGCIGGVVAAAWLGPWLNAQLGARLGGIAGTLIGRILLFIANKLSIGIPRAMVKKLLQLGCISPAQGQALSPGLPAPALTSENGQTADGEQAANVPSTDK
jgi:hypothetical protein